MRGKLPFLQAWFDTQSPLVITRPALRETVHCGLALGGGFLLASGSLCGTCSPFALGFLVAAGGGLQGLCALLGAVLGFLLRHPFVEGLEATTTAILIYVTLYIFGSLWITKRPWFRCLVPGMMTGVMGALFLMDTPLTAVVVAGFAARVLLAALSPLAFDALLARRRSLGSLLALSCFLLGAASYTVAMVNLGALAAATLAAAAIRRCGAGEALLLAAGGGLAVDAMALPATGGCTVVLCTAALAGCVPRRWPVLRLALFFTGGLAAAACLGLELLPAAAVLALGCCLSLAVPAFAKTAQEESTAGGRAEERLTQGADALYRLYDALGVDETEARREAQSQIFDKAAAKVCRCCTQWNSCWEKNGAETSRALRSAMPAILERQEAKRDDFPNTFSEDCRHMEGLVTAVNQQLEELAYRSQCRTRLEEQKRIVGRTLLHVSGLLRKDADLLGKGSAPRAEAYTVDVGVAAKGRGGDRTSGDRGVCFQPGDGKLYAVLCDGAGSGEEAAAESRLAVDALTELIEAGMSPESAMELLNSVYVLRDDGGFSTMDIAEISLLTGEAVLYKWGAAPSYVRDADGVKKFGTAALPPGIGVGNTDRAEVIRLSLWGEDSLILVSDGVVGKRVEETIAAYGGESSKELASLLIQQAEADTGGEDDMTAAVLRMHERRR